MFSFAMTVKLLIASLAESWRSSSEVLKSSATSSDGSPADIVGGKVGERQRLQLLAKRDAENDMPKDASQMTQQVTKWAELRSLSKRS